MVFDNLCRCDGAAMNGSDHCPECFCEEFEERAGCAQAQRERAMDALETMGVFAPL